MSGDVGIFTEVEAGVSAFTGAPFVTVRTYEGTDTTGKLVASGQLSPSEVRTMALYWLEVAEAAEQDAATLSVIRELGLPDELAGHVVRALRARRDPR